MSLSDIVGRVIDLCDIGGEIDMHKAVQTAFPLVLADAEARDQVIMEGLARRIKEVATRLRRKGRDGADDQPSFFGDRLRRRYALDLDGRVVKDTDSMTRLEFERLISIREKQLLDDTTHLAVLREAREALGPIWDTHPEYTYGQAETYFLRGEAA